MMLRTINAMALALTSITMQAPALAIENLCQPLDTTAKILIAPSPDSIHPHWQGGDQIGLSWTLVKYGQATKEGVQYLKGKLLSPFRPGRYSLEQYINGQGEIVWVIASEWECR